MIMPVREMGSESHGRTSWSLVHESSPGHVSVRLLSVTVTERLGLGNFYRCVKMHI